MVMGDRALALTPAESVRWAVRRARLQRSGSFLLAGLVAAGIALGVWSDYQANESLRSTGAHFRNDIVTGVGGKQIILEDPSGNPIELFEPLREEARLGR